MPNFAPLRYFNVSIREIAEKVEQKCNFAARKKKKKKDSLKIKKINYFKLKSSRYVILAHDNDILGHIILSHGLQSRACTCLLQRKCWSNFCDAGIFKLIFFSYYFDRNQLPLCKYFDGKSLAISHNSMNSIRFLARSKFHENQHPESVSRGNMHTFLLGLLHPELPWSRPLWFVLFP